MIQIHSAYNIQYINRSDGSAIQNQIFGYVTSVHSKNGFLKGKIAVTSACSTSKNLPIRQKMKKSPLSPRVTLKGWHRPESMRWAQILRVDFCFDFIICAAARFWPIIWPIV